MTGPVDAGAVVIRALAGGGGVVTGPVDAGAVVIRLWPAGVAS